MKVFISYSPREEQTVNSLVNDLWAAAAQPWRDELRWLGKQRLRNDDLWWAAILDHIRDCTVFVFAWSLNSLYRLAPCMAELGYAKALGLPILPVQISDVARRDPIERELSKLCIDYRQPASARRRALMQALTKSAAQREDLPDPLPGPPGNPFAHPRIVSERYLLKAWLIDTSNEKAQPDGTCDDQWHLERLDLGADKSLINDPLILDVGVDGDDELAFEDDLDDLLEAPAADPRLGRPSGGRRLQQGPREPLAKLPDPYRRGGPLDPYRPGGPLARRILDEPSAENYGGADPALDGPSGGQPSEEEASGWGHLTDVSGLEQTRRLTGVRVTGRVHEKTTEEDVDCSVFAPPIMSPGSSALVQVFVHLPTQAKSVGRIARQFDQLARRRGVQTLEVPIARGEHLTFDLRIRGIEIPEPVQQLRWLGRPAAVQFEALVPNDLVIGQSTTGTVSISRRGVAIGSIKFTVRIESGCDGSLIKVVGNEAKRFTRAFVSYASQDRAAVIARVQTLRALDIEYFQDIEMDPGERWERELYRQIDRCDLFLLFWSQSAKDSEWVRREVKYALGLGKRVPEIRPVVVEGPPVPLPWDELAHLHFNDRLLSMLAVAAAN